MNEAREEPGETRSPPERRAEDLEREVALAATLAARSPRDFLQSVALVSEAYLAQVLIALWDSGLYEYVRRNGRVRIEEASGELRLDPAILGWLIEYLVGRGLMTREEDAFVLSARGHPYWNYVARGVLTAHVGGYNPLLTRLGPLLRKEIDLDDPSLDRDGRLVALGAGYSLLANNSIAWVLKEIRRLGGRYVLDLGCGAGDFLIQLALRWPDGGGVGIDLSPEGIGAARASAESYGVADRLVFHRARLSEEPMDLPTAVLDRVDTLTSMYVLHEFGGHGGPEGISSIIASLRMQFPGRKLLMAEGTRANALELNAHPPRTYAQLDYSFIHPLSGQGPLRTPEEWERIIEAAGARLLERIPGFNMVPAWISLYVIAFD